MTGGYHLFEGFGIELEYMIVDRDTLSVRPIAGFALADESGAPSADLEFAETTWSNELAAHVVELKTSRPVSNILQCKQIFPEAVRWMNTRLAEHGCMLLPTAVHPLMNPTTEGELWAYEGSEIYRWYDEVFGCRSHGWLNLQSMHINISFQGDEEFCRLHRAIRLVLPLLPALAASSPLLEGKFTGVCDSRLQHYLEHQRTVPATMGEVIPEILHSEEEYRKQILNRIAEEIRPFNAKGLMKADFMNARGAIARFDRGSIEIRLIDIQECPDADVAIAECVIAVVRDLVEERSQFEDVADSEISASELRTVLNDVVRHGGEAKVSHGELLRQLGLEKREIAAADIWGQLVNRVKSQISDDSQEILRRIEAHGNLATRLMRVLGKEPSRLEISEVYQELGRCLAQNRMFLGA
ncbi:MAG: hypothetical protein KDD60_03320 [Bdellovibrionales bacterium]|nr:hypothetical protein [Bdellovibrionales bacterium]